MNQVRMNGEMFRKFRQERAEYMKALERIYCGGSVQLRTPNGKAITLRFNRDMSGAARPQNKPRLMLCEIETGNPVRPATPDEINLAQLGKQNRNPTDPIYGRITAQGKAYYVKMTAPESEPKEEEIESPEPLQDEAIPNVGDDTMVVPGVEIEETTVTKEDEIADLKRRLKELEAAGADW